MCDVRERYGRWELLRQTGVSAVWKAGPVVVKVDREGRAATTVPAVRALGVPAPAVVGHGMVHGWHMVVSEHVDHYQVGRLSAAQWADLMVALRPLHEADPSAFVADGAVPYGPSQVGRMYERLDAAHVAGGWHQRMAEKLRPFVVRAAGRLARPFVHVPVHSDLHADNVLVSRQGLMVVDWDLLRLGPAELDGAGAFAAALRGETEPAVVGHVILARDDFDVDLLSDLGMCKQVSAATFFLAESAAGRHERQAESHLGRLFALASCTTGR